MPARVRVFIASSTEGLDVAKAVRGLLVRELGDRAAVDLWTWKFALSATYIESLEKAAREADFSILTLTPDDLTTSRKVEKLSPRDNVVFELGLFMGSLGRERCFLVHERRLDLKLPTDLLGVNAAAYKRAPGDDLKAALDAEVLQIVQQIDALGRRRQPSPETLASRAAIHRFSERVVGAWWELISWPGRGASSKPKSLSFFQVEPDEVFDSVQLQGRYYDEAGALLARWHSIVVRIEPNEPKILYHWQGFHAATPNDRFHGFAEKEFEAAARRGAPFTHGHGKFWEVNEARPKETIVRSVELRRVVDANVAATLVGGREKTVRSLILKTFNEW